MPITHVLFDFFGTLVDFTAGPAPAVRRCTEVLRGTGPNVDEAEFTRCWDAQTEAFMARSATDHREFSMDQLAAAVLTELTGAPPEPAQARALAAAYVQDWNAVVAHPARTAEVVRDLTHLCLAVVSNTHDTELIPHHLDALGLTEEFAAVITSVEVGWAKPHPAIYAEALSTLGIEPAQAVFVGDSYEPDFIGPQAAGIHAFLIDPDRVHGVPEVQRLDSLADLPTRLRALAQGR